MKRPRDNRPARRVEKAHTHVRERTNIGTIAGVDTAPLMKRLNDLVEASEFPHISAMAVAAGIDPSTISKWKKNKQRPSGRYLTMIARVLGVPALELWELAGLVEDGTTDYVFRPAGVPSEAEVGRPSITTTPPGYDRLGELYNRLDATQRQSIDMQISMLVAWAEGELSRPAPTGT